MNPREAAVLIETLEKVDAGKPVPRMSGLLGSFLRRYQRERADIVQLAVECGVPLRLDGAISGEPFSRISLTLLCPDETMYARSSPWGDVTEVLALSRELWACVSLRIWHQSASAREALRVASADPAASFHVWGDFRWLPPTSVTCGRADFEIAATSVVESWQHAPYLKATADDLTDVPHALDFRPIRRNQALTLAAIRTIVGTVMPSGAICVPGVQKAPTTLGVSNPERVPTGSAGQLCFFLILQTPTDRRWSIWEGELCDVDEAVRHIATWVRQARMFRGLGANLEAEFDTARQSLESAGIDATDVSLEQRDPWPQRDPSTLQGFAMAVAAKLRT